MAQSAPIGPSLIQTVHRIIIVRSYKNIKSHIPRFSHIMAGLFDLPPELRIAIWETVLGISFDVDRVRQPPLLHTNHFLRNEALRTYLNCLKAAAQQMHDVHESEISAKIYEIASYAELDLDIKQEAVHGLHAKTVAFKQRIAPLETMVARVQEELDGSKS